MNNIRGRLHPKSGFVPTRQNPLAAVSDDGIRSLSTEGRIHVDPTEVVQIGGIGNDYTVAVLHLDAEYLNWLLELIPEDDGCHEDLMYAKDLAGEVAKRKAGLS